jgi:hypothetical protein
MITQVGHPIVKEDARERISAVLKKLRQDRSLGTETKAEDDNGSVDYHIDNIVKAGGGIWNELVAKDYIQNLEAQVGQETDAPGRPMYKM